MGNDYIQFNLKDGGRWAVRVSGVFVGSVERMGAFDFCAFFPAPHRVLDARPLRDIADFCEKRTAELRAAPPERQPEGG
jgi:hypothetical protein